MKYVYLTLNWVFGILALLLGLTASFMGSLLAGVSFILIALLLLPPVRKFVYSKTNRAIPLKARGIAIFVLLIAFGIFSEQSESRKKQEVALQKAHEQAEKATAARQQNIDYFNQNSAQILSEIRAALSNSDFKNALALSSKYNSTKNPELIELNAKANAGLAAIERREKTQAILAQLKEVSADQLQKNKDLYQQLANLNPDTTEYATKLNFYAGKIKAQEEKERLAQEKERLAQEKIQKASEARVAKFGNQPTKSGWGGSYYAVEKYLKRVANDPDSIKIEGCTEVYNTNKGWLVGCDYRGRNAFGGMIRQSNWFTIVHDTVVQMHDASAYKP